MVGFADDVDELGQGETFLDVETGDAIEPKAVAAGEYKIKIVNVSIDTDKNGHPYMLPRFEVVGEPAAKDFTQFLRLPHDELSEKQLNAAKWNLSQFKQAFGMGEGKISLDEMMGLEGWAILGVREDEEFGQQNTLRKYIAAK